MRRAIPIIILLLLAIPAGAQLFKKSNKSVAPEYQAGAVPVVNGRVTFEEFIPADGLTAAQVDERVGEWISKRFVQPP